jgi:two-component system, cell cycle sensor histidine kinase and response regulator CckA
MSDEEREPRDTSGCLPVDPQLILDAIPALIFHKDADNRLVYANRAALEAWGASTAAALVGTDLRHWLSDEGGALDAADLRVLRSGQPQLGSLEQVTLPGRGQCCFETARLPQHAADGQVSGLVVVSREDRLELAAKYLQAQKLESIGQLAGGVAHDFNNLLTTFFGLIAAAQRVLPSESLAHEYLALMQLAAEGGANFTRQLLAFARRQNIEPRVIDLNDLVRQTSTLLSRVLGAHISIDLKLSPERVPVRVDPSQISQLLMNLALNARDAMPEQGRLTFRTASVELEDPGRWSLPASSRGRYAQLEVEDTGEGLSPEAREHLFEPFFTSKALGQGTGLGLATCYGIVKQNHGHIGVESEPGQWTRFRIYLPEAEAPLEEVSPPRTPGPVPVGNETVLFAEDDDLVRHLSVAALSSSGYRLIEAAHGAEALKATEQHAGPIHLLVTDIIMPRMGGVELARRFRQLRPGAAVLFISGYAGDAVVPVGNGVEVLHKPFTTEVLLARVRAVLDALPADTASARGALRGAVGT